MNSLFKIIQIKFHLNSSYTKCPQFFYGNLYVQDFLCTGASFSVSGKTLKMSTYVIIQKYVDVIFDTGNCSIFNNSDFY